MGPVRVGLLAVLLVVTTEAGGQVSIGSLRSHADSSNLELVTLQGVVHLSRSRQNGLGGSVGVTPPRCKMTPASLMWRSVARIV
jgi:hypothetical protein